MKCLRLSIVACVLTAVLATSALAGDMPFPVAAPAPPSVAGEMPCPIVASSDTVTDFAFSLIQSALSLF